MNSTWWRRTEELDSSQRAFIELPPKGRLLLDGPPGSGKTNLLLLRAQFVAGCGEKNILVVTYTNVLADFIRSGISHSDLISPSQIRTYHSWATEHVRDHLGPNAVPTQNGDFNEEARTKLAEAVKKANRRLPSKTLYSAIFVDEAQDLSVNELQELLRLSENVCICGDVRQGIYRKDGMTAEKRLGLTKHTLKTHYRIGPKIARVADRLIVPKDGLPKLEETCNYNPKTQGESRAEMHVCPTRDDQFEEMIANIRVQLDAFNDEMIGVFCGKKATLQELRMRFNQTDLSKCTCVHSVDAVDSFQGKHRIQVLTIHAAKGTEFRAVHLFGVEELRKFPMNRREIGYTAVTRAKTALHAYRTGETNGPLEAAFCQPKLMSVDDLFSEGS